MERYKHLYEVIPELCCMMLGKHKDRKAIQFEQLSEFINMTSIPEEERVRIYDHRFGIAVFSRNTYCFTVCAAISYDCEKLKPLVRMFINKLQSGEIDTTSIASFCASIQPEDGIDEAKPSIEQDQS